MFRIVFLAVIVASIFIGNVANSSAQEFDELTLVQLERQLNSILKTRLNEEKLYIATIVKLVNDGKLPRKLINTSFKYVKNKRPYTKYPFVYFARVLHFQAKRERVEIPKFDFSVYSNRR